MSYAAQRRVKAAKPPDQLLEDPNQNVAKRVLFGVSEEVALLVRWILVVALTMMLLACGGREGTAPAATGPAATGADVGAPELNAVQYEMRLLEAAMREVLTMLANNQLEPVPKRIFAVHEARDLTEKAIAAGRYRPPREPDAIDAFVATDRAFHDDLVRLVRAARKNDLAAATQAYADVVVGCTACHQRFRFPAAPPE